MEKELKTKAFSAAGLNAASKLDPEEVHKEDIRKWISDQTDTLETQIDALEAEKETLVLSTKKTKKVDSSKQDRLDSILKRTERHRYHQNRLELVLRMMDNGNVKPDQVCPTLIVQVDKIKDDVMYYIDENQDPDFEENEFLYEDLNLEEAEVFFGNDEDENSDREEPRTPPKEEKIIKKETKKIDGEEKITAAAIKANVTPKKVSKPKEEVTPKMAVKVVSVPKPAPTTPRAVVPTPADVPVPPVALRYAAAAAIAIPKSEPVPEGLFDSLISQYILLLLRPFLPLSQKVS